MRHLFLIFGRIFGTVYPYSLHLRLLGIMQWFYTGYCTSGFKHWGHNSKTGFRMRICGQDKIVVRNNVYIGSGTSLTAFCNDGDNERTKITIGSGCMIGADCHITAINGITIGDGLLTGKSVLISDNSHGNPSDYRQLSLPPYSRTLHSKGTITIGNNVWIGEKAAILGGVTIGDGAVIGANAVVTHDVPPYSIAAGCPAVILKQP